MLKLQKCMPYLEGKQYDGRTENKQNKEQRETLMEGNIKTFSRTSTNQVWEKLFMQDKLRGNWDSVTEKTYEQLEIWEDLSI